MIKKIICWLVGHQLETTKKGSDRFHMTIKFCTRCRTLIRADFTEPEPTK